MKLRLTTRMATLVALFTLSATASADWINGASNDQSVSNTTEQSKKPIQNSSDVNDIVKSLETNKAHINIESKIPTDEKANVIIDTTSTKPISGTTTIQMPINGQNSNNGAGFNMPWGNYNNGGAYPISPMNPMRYGYPPSQNGYYNIVPMMPPQQMMRPQAQQMFPTLSYEQQQAQMDRIRLQFEAMAKRVANAQKALAEAHHKAKMQSQAPLTAPIATENISEKK